MGSQPATDRVLIARYLDGNQSSLEELILRHKNQIFSYILMLVHDRHLAEDFFQETFIKVINTLHSGGYKEKGKFAPWVMRIAHNLIMDHFRISKKTPHVISFDNYDHIQMTERNTEEKMVVEQTHSEVMKLVECLLPEQKEVIYLRHFANLSFKEIAEETDVNLNTALSRMRYALINIRKLAKDKGIELSQ